MTPTNTKQLRENDIYSILYASSRLSSGVRCINEDEWPIEALEAREREVRREERERIVEVIQKDNRAGGMYSGLAQYTHGYDTATQRVINLIQALSEGNDKGEE